MPRASRTTLHSLLHSVKSIRDTEMRRSALARQLLARPPETSVTLLRELVAAAGVGNTQVSEAIASLVSLLGSSTQLPYQLRAELYSAASDAGAPEIGILLLEGEERDNEADASPTRAIVPGQRPLSLGARKWAARTHDRQQLGHLIADPHPDVVAVVLDNPHLREDDVVIMASKRPCSGTSLRHIAHHPRWSPRPRVRLALALNPSCNLHLACRLVLDLRDSALDQVVKNASSPVHLRAHAERLLARRRHYREEQRASRNREAN